MNIKTKTRLLVQCIPIPWFTMPNIVYCVFLGVVATLVTSEQYASSNGIQPECGIRNQFRGYCFSFDYCTSSECNREKCGYFPRNSEILKIQRTQIIPQCAVTNSTTLKTVSGINSNIHVLASGSFANLPNLNSIILPFNLIRELHHGIFYNVNVRLIDLSWNKIIYISEGAFNGVSGLKYLNLSKNELSTLPVENIPRSVIQINLSYNFLKRIALNGAKRPHLTYVDLSHNHLKNVALSFDNTIEELDLSDNRLNDIDFYDIYDCINLKIPSNLFSEIPQFLEYSRIRRVALHPNPWKCDELKLLWVYLNNNNVEEEKPNNTESQPLCSINFEKVHFANMKLRLSNSDDLECDEDKHCSQNLLCRAHKCLDPCDSVCSSTSICNVDNHIIECLCPGTKKKNPRDVFNECYDVECFLNTDCSLGQFCDHNKKCSSFILHPLEVPVHPHYTQPESYPHDRQPEFATFKPTANDGGKDFNEELPWWITEIPKLTPSNTVLEN